MNSHTVATIREEIRTLRARGVADILVSVHRDTGEAIWGEAMALPRKRMEAEMKSIGFNPAGMMTAEEFEQRYRLTRTENAARVRLPREERARVLGVTPLAPGEASVNVRIRAPIRAVEALLKMTPAQRGVVLVRGLAKGDRYGTAQEG